MSNPYEPIQAAVETNSTHSLNSPIKSKGEATIVSSVSNLANTILGAGTLGLPFAYSVSGYFLGTFFLCICATFSCIGLYLLSKSALHVDSRHSSFYKVSHVAVPGYEWIIDAAVSIKCFGVASSYLIVIGDLVPDLMSSLGAPTGSILLERRLWIVVYFFLAVTPLAFLRKMDSLKFTSMVSLVFFVYLLVVVLLFSTDIWDGCESFQQEDIPCPGKIEAIETNLQTAKNVSIFIFGFTCHQNIFTIVNELRNNTQARMNVVIGTSIGTALAVYLIVAYFGYITFGALVSSDLMQAYPDSTAVDILRAFISLMVAFSFPLQCHPARRSALQLIELVKGADPYSFEYEVSDEAEDELDETEHLRRTNVPFFTRFNIVTICFLVGAFLVSMVVKDLGVVLSMVGATGSTTITYILPGLCYINCFPEERSFTRMLAYLQLGLGIVIIPTCLTFIFL